MTSRRALLKFVGGASLGLLAAACQSAPPPAPTVLPATPRPTSPPATSAPAPTASPAAKPTQAPTAAPAIKPASLQKVTAAYGFVSPTAWPLWAAAEKGYWQKYGLDVELTRTENAARAVQALLGNSAQVAFASGPTMMGPVVEGAKIKILATLHPKSLDSLLAKPGTSDPANLKGGKVALGALGDLSHMTAYLMLQSLGLDPEKDVSFVQIGNDAARAAALQSGAVDAAPLNPTASEKLVKELGFPVLIRGEEKGIAFPSVNLGTSAAVFEKEPAALKAMLKGILDGIDWVTNPGNEQEARAMLARELKVTPSDPSIHVSYQLYIPGKQFAMPPTVDRAGLKYVQEFSAKFNPKMQEIDVESIVDDTLLKAAVAERA